MVKELSVNVFVLDWDLTECARAHGDKHVVKMITETAQLLSSSFYATGQQDLTPYRLSHANHPWAIWARKSLTNWKWLAMLGLNLYLEYVYRYGNRVHASGEVICKIIQTPPDLKDIGLTPMPLCMPDDCKTNNVVESYRNYYRFYKSHLHKYTKRDKPKWIEVRDDTDYK